MTAASPILIPCRECLGCGLRTNDHPNDPWAKTWECRECEGTGEVVGDCQCCDRDATKMFDGLRLCAICAAEQMQDATEAAEWRDER